MVEMSTIIKEKEWMEEIVFSNLFFESTPCDKIERSRLMTYNIIRMPVNELVSRQEKGREFVD